MPYQLISADSHVVEPPDLWEKWLPKEFSPQAPKLVKDAEGGDAWQYRPGTPPVPLGLVTTYPGRTYEQFKWTGARYDKVNQGAFIGAHADQRAETSTASTPKCCIPSQRTMRHFMLDDDNEFHKQGIQAYNNWMAKEFMAADSEAAHRPGADAEPRCRGDDRRDATRQGRWACVASSCRAGRAAARRCQVEDNAFWAEAEKLDLPVSIHLGVASKQAVAGQAGDEHRHDGGWRHAQHRASKTVVGYSCAGLDNMPVIIAETILSRLVRHVPAPAASSPSRPAPAGCRTSWSRWTTATSAIAAGRKVELEMLPSAYFRRNWLVTFVQDFYGVRNRHAVGIGNMMWSTDYPHHICDWPYSRKLANEMFAGVPENERNQICAGNAAALYRLQ